MERPRSGAPVWYWNRSTVCAAWSQSRWSTRASGLAEGLALLRAGISEADRRGLTAGWRAVELPALLAQLDPETRPVPAALVGSMDATMDVEQMFEFGLARLLDGIAQFVESEGSGRANLLH